MANIIGENLAGAALLAGAGASPGAILADSVLGIATSMHAVSDAAKGMSGEMGSALNFGAMQASVLSYTVSLYNLSKNLHISAQEVDRLKVNVVSLSKSMNIPRADIISMLDGLSRSVAGVRLNVRSLNNKDLDDYMNKMAYVFRDQAPQMMGQFNKLIEQMPTMQDVFTGKRAMSGQDFISVMRQYNYETAVLVRRFNEAKVKVDDPEFKKLREFQDFQMSVKRDFNDAIIDMSLAWQKTITTFLGDMRNVGVAIGQLSSKLGGGVGTGGGHLLAYGGMTAAGLMAARRVGMAPALSALPGLLVPGQLGVALGSMRGLFAIRNPNDPFTMFGGRLGTGMTRGESGAQFMRSMGPALLAGFATYMANSYVMQNAREKQKPSVGGAIAVGVGVGTTTALAFSFTGYWGLLIGAISGLIAGIVSFRSQTKAAGDALKEFKQGIAHKYAQLNELGSKPMPKDPQGQFEWYKSQIEKFREIERDSYSSKTNDFKARYESVKHQITEEERERISKDRPQPGFRRTQPGDFQPVPLKMVGDKDPELLKAVADRMKKTIAGADIKNYEKSFNSIQMDDKAAVAEMNKRGNRISIEGFDKSRMMVEWIQNLKTILYPTLQNQSEVASSMYDMARRGGGTFQLGMPGKGEVGEGDYKMKWAIPGGERTIGGDWKGQSDALSASVKIAKQQLALLREEAHKLSPDDVQGLMEMNTRIMHTSMNIVQLGKEIRNLEREQKMTEKVEFPRAEAQYKQWKSENAPRDWGKAFEDYGSGKGPAPWQDIVKYGKEQSAINQIERNDLQDRIKNWKEYGYSIQEVFQFKQRLLQIDREEAELKARIALVPYEMRSQKIGFEKGLLQERISTSEIFGVDIRKQIDMIDEGVSLTTRDLKNNKEKLEVMKSQVHTAAEEFALRQQIYAGEQDLIRIERQKIALRYQNNMDVERNISEFRQTQLRVMQIQHRPATEQMPILYEQIDDTNRRMHMIMNVMKEMEQNGAKGSSQWRDRVKELRGEYEGLYNQIDYVRQSWASMITEQGMQLDGGTYTMPVGASNWQMLGSGFYPYKQSRDEYGGGIGSYTSMHKGFYDKAVSMMKDNGVTDTLNDSFKYLLSGQASTANIEKNSADRFKEGVDKFRDVVGQAWGINGYVQPGNTAYSTDTANDMFGQDINNVIPTESAPIPSSVPGSQEISDNRNSGYTYNEPDVQTIITLPTPDFQEMQNIRNQGGELQMQLAPVGRQSSNTQQHMPSGSNSIDVQIGSQKVGKLTLDSEAMKAYWYQVAGGTV